MFNLVSQRFCLASSHESTVKRFKPVNACHVSALACLLISLDHACQALSLIRLLQFDANGVFGGWQVSSFENSVWVGFDLSRPKNKLK